MSAIDLEKGDTIIRDGQERVVTATENFSHRSERWVVIYCGAYRFNADLYEGIRIK